NDRLDVAVATRAAGVHLKSTSFSPAAARSMTAPGFLVGRSIHSRAEGVEHAPEVDYLIAGTVFPTESKPAVDHLLGTSGLKAIVDAVRVPVLAIGGMTTDRLEEVAEVGASGIAGISLFLNNSDRLSDVVAAVHTRFESVKTRF
ncbi:MAG: hypothetical protein C5B57_10125, partial [Blastocatellia bacterium]